MKVTCRGFGVNSILLVPAMPAPFEERIPMTREEALQLLQELADEIGGFKVTRVSDEED